MDDIDDIDSRIAARIAHLTTLADGWLDGAGQAPTAPSLATAWQAAKALGPDVAIYPHPEGGVQLEWGHDGPVCWSMEIDRKGTSMYVHGASFHEPHLTTVWDDSGVEGTFSTVGDAVSFVREHSP